MRHYQLHPWAAACVCLLLSSTSAWAQNAVQPLVTKAVDESQMLTLSGNTHPLATPKFDTGAAPASLPLHRMLLVLKRGPAQQSALNKLLDAQQDSSSPMYHKWLSPDEFGQQFGPVDQDIQAVTGWLQSHGFQIARVSRGHTVIEFSGTAGQVQQAFHAQMHQYMVNGESHWANASDPQIPAALAPVVAGINTLHNFPKKPMSRVAGTYSAVTRTLQRANPEFTFPGNCASDGNCYAMVPYDFATIYNVLPLWNANIDGTGQTIAIVGRTNINIQDMRDFRNLFGLPANDPQVILNGPDPGINGDETESDLDLQWTAAVAKNATIYFVTSQTTETTDGVDLSAEYVIENNLAAVMSESYGNCEQAFGTAGNAFFNTLWEQASAQGITVTVSSGDNGSAGCDFYTGSSPQPAVAGLAVNGIASTPFNVAVGGTDFNDPFNPQTYWKTANDPVTQASAKGYIPELVWNDACTNPLWGQVGFSGNAEANCNDRNLNKFVFTIGGSGAASAGYSKPAWQTGTGVPKDGKRDVPDVSLFASDGFLGNFYVICESDYTGVCTLNSFLGVGGTSASSPAFAGIMALVNQKTGSRQGNANYILYKLAAQQSPTTCNSTNGPAATCMFYDITSGTNAMPCASGSPNCTVSFPSDQFGVLSGYAATSGYDPATGLGTINAANLVNNWHNVTLTSSTTTLGLTPTSITHGQNVTVSITVAPGSGSTKPTGDVALLTSNGKGVDHFTLSNGASSGTTARLPGGIYSVTGHYSGDGAFAPSDSSATNVTVNPENSKVTPQLVTFDSSGNPTYTTTAVYGSPYLLRVNVTNSAGTQCGPLGGCPTGTLALTVNGSPLDQGTYSLNSLGYFEDFLVQLPGGSNSVQGQYSGDSSFNPSTGTAVMSITPAPTTMAAVFPGPTPAVGLPVNLGTTVQTTSSGVAPGGAVTFTSNGSALQGTVSYGPTSGSANGSASLSANITPTFNAPGTYNVAAAYSGDTNYSSSSSGTTSIAVKYLVLPLSLQPASVTVAAGSPVTLTTVVVTAQPSTIPPSGAVSFTSSVGQPTGNATYATVTDAGTGNPALQATVTFTPAYTDSFTAAYAGDANYYSSQASYTGVTVNGTDFTLSPQQTSVAVAAGASGQIDMLVGVQTGAAAITFSASPCSGLPSEATCSINTTSVSNTQIVSIFITTTAPHALSQRAGIWGIRLTGMLGFGLLGMVLIGGPRRQRRYMLCALLLMLAVLIVAPGCGGGGSNSGPPPPQIDPGTPKGSSTITVTGTSGTITHSATFTLVVQ